METSKDFLSLRSLNPCFSGGWSRSSETWSFITILLTVLILVLVEDGLGGQPLKLVKMTRKKSLNPCFSGGWSRSNWEDVPTKWDTKVLILVLVEDGLGVYGALGSLMPSPFTVLILVLVEDGLGAC